MGNWYLLSNQYGDFSCSVLWNQIHQGVKQGGIPSPILYFVDELLSISVLEVKVKATYLEPPCICQRPHLKLVAESLQKL